MLIEIVLRAESSQHRPKCQCAIRALCGDGKACEIRQLRKEDAHKRPEQRGIRSVASERLDDDCVSTENLGECVEQHDVFEWRSEPTIPDITATVDDIGKKRCKR